MVTINHLPEEILSHVFSYLSLEDRKCVVKFTCRSWYRCSNDPAVTKNDKLVFTAFKGHTCFDVYRLLRNTSIKCPNVELNRIDLTNVLLVTEMWRKRGSELRCVCLYDCAWTVETLKNILYCCPELEELQIGEGDRSSENWRKISSFFFEENEILLKRMVHPKLQTLRILNTNEIGAIFPTVFHYEKLFIIFPSLRCFGYDAMPHGSCRDTSSSFGEMFTMVNGDVFTNLKELVLNIYSEGQWIATLSRMPTLRLTKLKTKYSYSSEISVHVFKFFENQPDLETVQFDCNWNSSNVKEYNGFLMNLLLHILRKCARLKKLSMQSYAYGWQPLALDVIDEFLQLVSRLDVVYGIPLGKLLEGCWDSPMNAVVANYKNKLRSLGLEICRKRDDIAVGLLRTCTSLKQLEISSITPKVLLEIFNQKSLVALAISCEYKEVFTHIHSPEKVKFRNNDNKLKLPQLEYLEVDEIKLISDIKAIISLAKLVSFPNLTTLAIQAEVLINARIKGNTLNRIPLTQEVHNIMTLLDETWKNSEKYFYSIEGIEAGVFFDSFPSLREIVILKVFTEEDDTDNFYCILHYDRVSHKVTTFRRSRMQQYLIRSALLNII